MIEEIRNICQKIVDNGDEKLEEYKEETGREPEYGFASLGLDADGIPYSMGNYDDVYEDGMQNGNREGEYDLAKRILAVIGE